MIKISEDELEFLTGEALLSEGVLRLCDVYKPELLLVTQGKQGVSVYRKYNAGLKHYPAPEVKAVDTTGAGDAFVAGLLAGLAQHWPLRSDNVWQSIIRQALACGSLATTARGAMTALPDSDTLKAFSS